MIPMTNNEQLIQRALNHVWHPASQMKDFAAYPPLVVNLARGSYLYTNRGPIIDAISSWWCKSLGHGDTRIISAIQAQLTKFEHIIGANTTNAHIVALAEMLAEITGNQHVFFASDGSSAVEIAMKIALQAAVIQGSTERNQFIALKNSYHGETLGTLAVSDLNRYKQPFAALNLNCHFLQNVPYVNGTNDPLWSSCETAWEDTLLELEKIKEKVCAILVEPIVQGAAGMLCYSSDFLARLAKWAKLNNIYLIADEIMTGFCRTGQWLAAHHADIQPDLICLSKGLTSGTMPLSCVTISHEIYELFYDEFEHNKAFLHSNTYSGHALGVRAALATIQTMRSENINHKSQKLGAYMRQCFTEIATQTDKIQNIRSIGAIVAGDLVNFSSTPRIGYELQQIALAKGALLRPIGNTIYWLPPLTTDNQTIDKLAQITMESIKQLGNYDK